MTKQTCGTNEKNALPCMPECSNFDECQLQAYRRDYSELGDIVLPAPHEQEEAQ